MPIKLIDVIIMEGLIKCLKPGEFEEKRTAHPYFTVHANLAALCFNKFFANRKAESCTGFSAAGNLEITVKNFGPITAIDPFSFIFYRKLYTIFMLPDCNGSDLPVGNNGLH